jgi:hypothetical protein
MRRTPFMTSLPCDQPNEYWASLSIGGGGGRSAVSALPDSTRTKGARGHSRVGILLADVLWQARKRVGEPEKALAESRELGREVCRHATRGRADAMISLGRKTSPGPDGPSMTTMPSESVRLPKPRSMLSRSSAGRSTRSLYEMRLDGGGRTRPTARRAEVVSSWTGRRAGVASTYTAPSLDVRTAGADIGDEAANEGRDGEREVVGDEEEEEEGDRVSERLGRPGQSGRRSSARPRGA